MEAYNTFTYLESILQYSLQYTEIHNVPCKDSFAIALFTLS